MIADAVIDASVAVKWVVDEAESDEAASLMTRRLMAPDLLFVECANILWKKARRGELTKKQATAALQQLLQAPIDLSGIRELVETAHMLSLELDHPAYDCLYLGLAVRERVPLITADKRLANVVWQHRKYASRVVLLGDA